MRTPDLIAVVYFGYLVLTAVAVRGVSGQRRALVAAGALGAMAAVVLAGRLIGPDSGLGVIRDWLPAVWLLLGYWLPGGLLHAPMPGLEAWLRASDRWMQDWRWARAQPAWLSGLFELAYLLVHLFVPAGLAVLLLGGLDASDHFWTPTLLAGYSCYGTLPWLQARPPRLVAAGSQPGSAHHAASGRLRGLNERFLAHVSVQANTFPSGHVAVALVVALVVFDLEPAAGLVFVPAALLIAAATVARRYHYTADVVFGLLVAVICWAGSRIAGA